MTELLCLEDSYRRTCDATVREVRDNRYVVLDRTVCYPRGGGQPGDTGRLLAGTVEYRIADTCKRDGAVLHDVGDAGDLTPGQAVQVTLDWERRYAHMRHHTAAHVLAAVLHEHAGALITGNQIYADRLRIDFSLEDYDPVRLQHYVDEANRLLALDAPVTSRTMQREDALKLPGVVKLAGALPPDIPKLRIVTIGDDRTGVIDEQADGGTHVRSTREVGTLRIEGTENKGKANRRIVVTLTK